MKNWYKINLIKVHSCGLLFLEVPQSYIGHEQMGQKFLIVRFLLRCILIPKQRGSFMRWLRCSYSLGLQKECFKNRIEFFLEQKKRKMAAISLMIN